MATYLYDSFDMMSVDEETKQIVSSYMRYHQYTLLGNNSLLRIIPELVHHITIRYYYRTHSIYEWKVNDKQQLENIRSAVPGQSFNDHFKLHNLDWFLKFYPNGTKQSKQGNVFLLLYLRSTPEISRMSATCKVWLTELDKGREHYKDFNDKNKYTGWRSGLVKTSEIADLDELTFQVTITIFEIYDKDGNNVTNKYIGLGIDSKQTIMYLRKELRFEKEKVQQLTIELDELHDRLYNQEVSLAAHRSLTLMEPDDEKSNNNHILSVMHRASTTETDADGLTRAADPCKVAFDRWLCDTVKLPQYVALFAQKECNDVRMIEFFDGETMEKELGITQSIHRKLIMKKAKEFTAAQTAFTTLCDADGVLQRYKQELENQGILTMVELRRALQSKDGAEELLGHIDDAKSVDCIWQKLNDIAV